jgi:uncharacterized protein (DUF488 family)
MTNDCQRDSTDLRPAVFTIGHSNQSLDSLLALLQRHEVSVVIDTRSIPRSRVAPQFDKQILGPALRSIGILYAHKLALGGRPRSKDFYDPDGHVRYDLIAKAKSFQAAVTRIQRGAQGGHRIALLCAEESPVHCHRRLLIGRVLRERGVELEHIRRDGRVQTEAELMREAGHGVRDHQVALFDHDGDAAWRSIRSVSPRSRPGDSSSS